MSEWKLKDIGYIRAVYAGHQLNNEDRNLRFVLDGGAIVYVRECDVLRSIPPQPAPVDVSQIKVGDEVTVKANVVDVHDDDLPFLVAFDGDCIWVRANEIASHTPSRPPSTLAEFDAMTPEQRERWFAEMVKGKVTT